jgi:heptosyltransferase-3
MQNSEKTETMVSKKNRPLQFSRPPASVLLISTRQIGDVLLTTPLLRAMRQAWPYSQIDVLVFKHTSGILEGNQDCDNILEIEERPDFADSTQLIKRIFRKYDLAVTVQASDRAHQYAFLAAGKRVGLIRDLSRQTLWKRMSCASWLKLDDVNTHTVIQNARLADNLSIARSYEVVPPASPNAGKTLDKLLGFNWRQDHFAIVHPYPMFRYKRWTDKGWRQLIEHFIARKFRIVLTGGSNAEEVSYCKTLAKDFPSDVISLAGKTDFGTLSTLLEQAKVFVGPDTVTTHLAAACGTPTLALFGPTNPVKWGPWPKGYALDQNPWILAAPFQRIANVLLLQGLGDCVPCHQEGCDRHKQSESRCMNELSTERVIVALEILLKPAV